MIKHVCAAVTACLFAAAALPTQSNAAGMPVERIYPSSAGQVTFHHEMHVKALEVKCNECHHAVNARPIGAPRPEGYKASAGKCPIDVKTLATPHPDYFKSSSIKCVICHVESDEAKQNAYTCSGCHKTNPVNIADETLSAKVVVHKQCWKCHPVGAGKDASAVCEKCHTGKKTF